MYSNVSNDFLDVLSRDSRTFLSRVTVNENVISNIKSYTLASGSCGAEAFSVGTVFSSYVDIVLPAVDVTLADQELFLETGLLLDDGTVEYVPMGYFTPGLSDVIKDRDQIAVKASDRLRSRCGGTYAATVTFPATIQAVLDDIASQASVSISTSFVTTGTVQDPLPLMLCSEALGYIAGLLGGFVFVDRTGTIRIEPFPGSSSISVEKNRLRSLSVNETTYEINRLSVTVKQGGQNADGEDVENLIYSAGSGQGIDLINPFMTQALFNNMSAALLGYEFWPGNAVFLGDPRLDPVDAITAENFEDHEFFIPCMSIVQVFDGGLQTTVTAPGLVSSDQAAQGPLQQQIIQLTADMILTKEVVAKKINTDEANIRYGTIEKAIIGTGSASDFTAAKLNFMTACGQIFSADKLTALSAAFDTATAGTITADNIDAARAVFQNAIASSFTALELAAASAEFRKAVVGELFVTQLNAGYARINFANVTTEAVKNLFVNVGMIEDAVIVEGRITGTLSGVTVVADLIQANAIVTGDLIVQDAENEGTYYRINPTASGLTIDELEALEYDKYVSGQYIVARSITADQIAVTDLVAFGATIAGLQLENGNIYSAGKSTVSSTAPGIYMDSAGQFVSGDAMNFIASWYDSGEDKWKVAIRADEINFGTGESVEDVVFNAASTASTALNAAEAASAQAVENRDAIRVNGLDLEAFRDEIRLAVSTLANSKSIFRGDALEDYQSDEMPTLLNYPTFTDFFIWDKCSATLYCSDQLICGTNNYAAHTDEILLYTTYNDFYQFRYDGTEQTYGWEQMTAAEVEALSNSYSYISVDNGCITIKSSRNNQTSELLIEPTGITPSLIYCC